MNIVDSTPGMPLWFSALLLVAAILVVLALVNYTVSRLAERRHPPTGAFLDIDGARLHYSDRGTGLVDLRHFSGERLAGYATRLSNCTGLRKSSAEWRRTGL